jgi:hypothetical protein
MYHPARAIIAAAVLLAGSSICAPLNAQTNFRPCPLPTMSTLVVEDPDTPGHILKQPERMLFAVDYLEAHHPEGSAGGAYSTVPSTPQTETHRWGMAYLYTICYQPHPWVQIINVEITETFGQVFRLRSGGSGTGGDPVDHDTWYEWYDGIRFLCSSDYSSGSQTTTCVADPE